MKVQSISNNQNQTSFKAYNSGVIKSLLKEMGYSGDIPSALESFDFIMNSEKISQKFGSQLSERGKFAPQKVILGVGNCEDSCDFHGKAEYADVSFNPPETFPKRLIDAYQFLMTKFAAYSKDTEGMYHF